jgi:hypothetical protein
LTVKDVTPVNELKWSQRKTNAEFRGAIKLVTSATTHVLNAPPVVGSQ